MLSVCSSSTKILGDSNMTSFFNTKTTKNVQKFIITSNNLCNGLVQFCEIWHGKHRSFTLLGNLNLNWFMNVDSSHEMLHVHCLNLDPYTSIITLGVILGEETSCWCMLFVWLSKSIEFFNRCFKVILKWRLPFQQGNKPH
jgi:hypothetical protein